MKSKKSLAREMDDNASHRVAGPEHSPRFIYKVLVIFLQIAMAKNTPPSGNVKSALTKS
jgi:hypothetical protein